MDNRNPDDDSTRIRQPASSDRTVPGRYQASIVIIKGYAEGMEYGIGKACAVIGRDKDADITLKDPLVSRQHAAIVYHDGAFHIRDMESKNGTVMNGAIVKEAELHHGDTFRVGNTVLQFILEDTGRSATCEIG